MVPPGTEHWRWPILPDLLLAAVLLTGAAGGLRITFDLPVITLLLSLLGYFVLAALLWRYRGWAPLTPADRVTMGRAILVLLLLGLLPAAQRLQDASHLVFALALVAVLLDGLDGFIARRLRCETAAGARFDMELDALLLLILSAWVMQWELTGAWVLLIGLWRYLFVMAGWWSVRLRQPLPASSRRRLICAMQGIGLALCLMPEFPSPAAPPLAAVLLGFLSYSFIVDLRALWQITPKTGG